MTAIKENSVLNAGVLPNLEHKTIQIGNHTISYDQLDGSKTPERTMVFCHGAFANRNDMRVLAEKVANLRPEDRLILVDVPWHGKSTSTVANNDPSVHTYAAVLGEWIDALKENGTIEGTFSWFGWSMGGSIGMLIDLNGTKIDELVLVNSAPYWETLENIVTAVPAFGNPITARDVFKGVLIQNFETAVTDDEREDLMSHFDTLIMDGQTIVNDLQAISTKNYDIREELANINAKTLVLSGTLDILATGELQDLLNTNIPDATMYIGNDSHASLLKQSGSDTIANHFAKTFLRTNE